MIIVNGMIEMQQNEPGSLAAVGDSCAETCRAAILGCADLSFSGFQTPTGFLRHPRCANVPQWDEADFSNDQLLPLMMATGLTDIGFLRTKGTKTFLALGPQLLRLRAYKTLACINYVQSLLRPSPADCLNMAILDIYLRSKGVQTILAMGTESILQKVFQYYQPEPDSLWLTDLYRIRL